MEADQQTTSMLDDVFFIVKKCVKRAVSCGSVDGICAVINHAANLLEADFCQVRYGRVTREIYVAVLSTFPLEHMKWNWNPPYWSRGDFMLFSKLTRSIPRTRVEITINRPVNFFGAAHHHGLFKSVKLHITLCNVIRNLQNWLSEPAVYSDSSSTFLKHWLELL